MNKKILILFSISMLVCTTFSVAATNVSSSEEEVKNPLSAGGNPEIEFFKGPSTVSRFNPVGTFSAKAINPDGGEILISLQFDDGSTSQNSGWKQGVAEISVKHRFRYPSVGRVYVVKCDAIAPGDGYAHKTMDVTVVFRKTMPRNIAPFELLFAKSPLLQYLLGI